MELEKRTWTYIEPPAKFEIAPCSCGNEETQWSEYVSHLWCEKCQKDFIPTHGGVFSGPIPLNTAKMLGMTFARFVFATEEIELPDDYVLYIKCHKYKDVFSSKKIPLTLREHKTLLDGKVKVHLGELMFKDGVIVIEALEALTGHIENTFTTTINIGYPNTKTFDLHLILEGNLKKFMVVNSEEYENFKKYILVNELEYELKVNEVSIKPMKV